MNHTDICSRSFGPMLINHLVQLLLLASFFSFKLGKAPLPEKVWIALFSPYLKLEMLKSTNYSFVNSFR